MPVVGAAPTRSPVQSNGAGPPVSVTLASVGAPTSRYCWSGVRVPVTESVPGATVADLVADGDHLVLQGGQRQRAGDGRGDRLRA